MHTKLCMGVCCFRGALYLYDCVGWSFVRRSGESAWESNPPARLVTPPNRFEDGDQHRPTPALVGNAT